MMDFGKKKKQDEYEEIYSQYQDSGFEFEYNNKKIGKSKMILKDELDNIDANKYNSDSMTIKCHSCGVYMDFVPNASGDALTGKWTCPNCGISVRERTAYTQLERENDGFLQRWLDDDDYEDFDWSDL